MALDLSSFTNLSAITSIPIGSSVQTPEAQSQARALLRIGMETTRLIEGSVVVKATETSQDLDKIVDSEIYIAQAEMDTVKIGDQLDKIKNMGPPSDDFLRSIYSLNQDTLNYLAFIQERDGLRYALARMSEQFEEQGVRFKPFYCEFFYHELPVKNITQSIAAFLGMYLDPILANSLRAFTQALPDSVSPDELEKNIWHHPCQLGFGAPLALEIYLKPPESAKLIQSPGFIRPQIEMTPDSIDIGTQYLDGLRNQANPISNKS